MWLVRTFSWVRSLLFFLRISVFLSSWIHYKSFLNIQIYRKNTRKVEENVNFLYPDSTNSNSLSHLLYHLSLIFSLKFLKVNCRYNVFPIPLPHPMSIFQIIIACLSLELEKYFRVYFFKILLRVFPKFAKTFFYITTI